MIFEWDDGKNSVNLAKHNVSFFDVMTVRFAYRSGVVRIIGAGYWRKGKAVYEKENQLHK